MLFFPASLAPYYMLCFSPAEAIGRDNCALKNLRGKYSRSGKGNQKDI